MKRARYNELSKDLKLKLTYVNGKVVYPSKNTGVKS